MSENLIPFRPAMADRVIVFIYDDGNTTVDLGNGTKLITGLSDTNFDSLHDVTDGRHPGLRARWALVTAVNPENDGTVNVGDKVLLEQLKWRRGLVAGEGGRKIWDIPVADILVVDDDGLTKDEMEKVANYLVGFDNGLNLAAAAMDDPSIIRDEIDNEILADLHRASQA